MKQFFSISSLLLFLNLISISTFAQSTGIVDFGTPNRENICRDGLIDNAGNHVFIHTDVSNQNMTISSVSSTFQTNWVLNFGTNCEGKAQIEQLSDGNYLAAASSSYIAQVVKLSPAGTVIWYKAFNGLFLEKFIQDADSTIYFAGGYYGKGVLGHLDTNGNVLWFTKNNRCNFYRDLIFTNDGNLAAAGPALYFNPDTKIVLSKLNKAGTELWTKEHSAAYSIYLNEMEQSTFDDCFYFSGTKLTANDPGHSDMLYGKFDSSGNFVGARTLSYPHMDNGWGMIQTNGNFFEFLGWSRPQEVCGGANVVFVKFNSELDTVLTKRYGELNGLNMTMYRLKKKSANELYAYGDAYMWSHIYYEDNILLKTDTSFNLTCNALPNVMTLDTIGFTSTDSSDFVIDSMAIFPNYATNTYVMITADGCTGQMLSGINSTDNHHEISIFPNPASDFVELKNQNGNALEIYIYDAQGRCVQTISNVIGDLKMNVGDLPNGIYNFVITDGQSVYTERISVAR